MCPHILGSNGPAPQFALHAIAVPEPSIRALASLGLDLIALTTAARARRKYFRQLRG